MSVVKTRLIGKCLGTRVANFGCKEGSGPPAHGEINGFASSLSIKVPFRSLETYFNVKGADNKYTLIYAYFQFASATSINDC